MRILALDLGTLTGWAVLNVESRRMKSGLWRLADDGSTQDHARFVDLAQILGVALSQEKPDRIAYEYVRHLRGRSGDAVNVYGGLRGILLHAAWSFAIPYKGYSPAEVKKAAGLRSHASKEQMVEAAGRRWPGVEFASDDEVDARYVALAAAGAKERHA